jgi:putative endonuclease
MPSRATGRRTVKQQDGGAAEERAARFLADHGLSIVGRNFRTRLGEIDLIARDGATLVFVEVRRRASSERYGGAAGSVGALKQRRLAAAARQYLSRLPSEPPCRFDVVALQGDDCDWLRDAFALA